MTRRARSWRIVTVALVVLDVFNLALQPWRAWRDLINTDFMDDATAARILATGSRCLYCTPVQHVVEQQYLGITLPTGQQSSFLHPPLAALALVPVTSLTPHVALLVFEAAMLACLVGAVAVLLPTVRTALGPFDATAVIVAGACSLPAAWGVALGQWDPLLLLGAALGCAWLTRRPLLAGAVLSLLFLKPQVVIMVPIALIILQRWRVLVGMMLGGAVWLVSTVAILGTDHLSDWWTRGIDNFREENTPMMGVAGVFREIFGSSSSVALDAGVAALGIATVLAWIWRAQLRRDETVVIPLALAVALLCAPHIWAHDLILLAVPLAVYGVRVSSTRAIVSGIALDVAYLIDSALPRPHAPAEFLVLTTIVVVMWIGLKRGRMPDGAAAPLR